MATSFPIPSMPLLPPLSGHFQPGHPLNKQAGEVLSQVLEEVGRWLSGVAGASGVSPKVDLRSLSDSQLTTLKGIYLEERLSIKADDPRSRLLQSLAQSTDILLRSRQDVTPTDLKLQLPPESGPMGVHQPGPISHDYSTSAADSKLFPLNSFEETFMRNMQLSPKSLETITAIGIRHLNRSGQNWSEHFLDKQLSSIAGQIVAMVAKTGRTNAQVMLEQVQQPYRSLLEARLSLLEKRGFMQSLTTTGSDAKASAEEPKPEQPIGERGGTGYVQAPEYKEPLPADPPYVTPIETRQPLITRFPDETLAVGAMSKPLVFPGFEQDLTASVYSGPKINTPKIAENVMSSNIEGSPSLEQSQESSGKSEPKARVQPESQVAQSQMDHNVVFVTRAQANKLRAQGATVIDVSSRGPEPYRQLSPFYPHGGIPVPGKPGMTADSVEGVWQGLKVFDEQGGIDQSYFSGRGKKRRGVPLGHALGSELLNYRDARKAIYLPTYRYMVENTPAKDVALSIVDKAVNGEKVYVHDFDTNGDVDNTRKPLAHASVLASLINEAVADLNASKAGQMPSNPLALGYLATRGAEPMTTQDYTSIFGEPGQLAFVQDGKVRSFIDVQPGAVASEHIRDATAIAESAAQLLYDGLSVDEILSRASRRSELLDRGALGFTHSEGDEVDELADPLDALYEKAEYLHSLGGRVARFEVELLTPESRAALADWPDSVLPEDYSSVGLFQDGVFDFLVRVLK